MLLIDDILTFPIKGIFWIFREIHNAAQQEQAGEADRITTALTELYMSLETGRITEAEFDARERELLDRLEQLQEPATGKPAPKARPKSKTGGRKKRVKRAEPAPHPHP
jgi:hypothetical protein